MRRSILAVWLLLLGVALWVSGRIVDTHPLFALVVGLATMIFCAFAAQPRRN